MQAVDPQCQRTAPGMFVLLGPTASSGVGGPGSLFEEQALESASFSKNFFKFFLSELNLFFPLPSLQTTERLNFSQIQL